MSDDIIYEIGLTLLPGIGDVVGKRFVSYCGSVKAIFEQDRKSLEKINGIRKSTVDAICSKEVLKRAEEEVRFMEKNDIRPLFYQYPDYPQRLLNCDDAPMMLYYKGNADLNAEKVVAIVGTRNITEYGCANCMKLVEDLVDDNVLIVSGLAYGVDTEAHTIAVKNDIPTVGVLGCGLQTIYPSTNKTLASRMVQNGGLLTECISGTQPDRENFPRRNRIIAGMADAVVVIESALKGGSLITAELANSYNRDVFAFPGRVSDIFSQGCNYLIRTNRASLIESVEDLRYVMRWDKKAKKEIQTQFFRQLTSEEKAIMDCFGEETVVALDDMIVKTGQPTPKLAALLLTLEFDGVIKALPGKRYQKM